MTPEQRHFVKMSGQLFADGEGVMVIEVLDTTTGKEVALLGHPYRGKFVPVAIMLTDVQEGCFKTIEKELDEPAQTASVKAIFDLLAQKEDKEVSE